MNRNYIASQLLEAAKEISAGGMFSTAKRIYDFVTTEQLVQIKKLAKKYRGRVDKTGSGFGNMAVRVRFTDNFPESFATRDAENFDKEAKRLGLEEYSGMEGMLFTSSDKGN